MSKVLEIRDSSAIAKISFNEETNEVGIAFTYKPDNVYIFECENVSDFETQVNNILDAKESIGKFVASSRKDGTLIPV
jgi:hypothetical protein